MFFFVIIVFCNFLADYKAQKKTVITKKNSYHVLWTQIKHRFGLFWHKKRYIIIFSRTVNRRVIISSLTLGPAMIGLAGF